MEDNIKVNINATGFPTQFTSDSVKDSKEFGLQVGQAIQYEWFRKDGTQCRYYNQWRDMNRLRLYARGEQPIAKYKNELAIDGDLSYLNLDWTPVPILPKFVDVVVNGMSDRLFKVKAYAQESVDKVGQNPWITPRWPAGGRWPRPPLGRLGGGGSGGTKHLQKKFFKKVTTNANCAKMSTTFFNYLTTSDHLKLFTHHPVILLIASAISYSISSLSPSMSNTNSVGRSIFKYCSSLPVVS